MSLRLWHLKEGSADKTRPSRAGGRGGLRSKVGTHAIAFIHQRGAGTAGCGHRGVPAWPGTQEVAVRGAQSGPFVLGGHPSATHADPLHRASHGVQCWADQTAREWGPGSDPQEGRCTGEAWGFVHLVFLGPGHLSDLKARVSSPGKGPETVRKANKTSARSHGRGRVFLP